jgi:acetolactate synthase regulatory subunit
MSSPAAAAAAADSPATTSFSVQARADPGVMPRLLELFAKRGLVPERLHGAVVRPSMRLTVDIAIAGIDRDTAEYVANCMRQVTGVELVLTA